MKNILRLISFINLMTLVITMLCNTIICYIFCRLIDKFVCLHYVTVCRSEIPAGIWCTSGRAVCCTSLNNSHIKTTAASNVLLWWSQTYGSTGNTETSLTLTSDNISLHSIGKQKVKRVTAMLLRYVPRQWPYKNPKSNKYGVTRGESQRFPEILRIFCPITLSLHLIIKINSIATKVLPSSRHHASAAFSSPHY